MVKRKDDKIPSAEMTSMIDIIFQLLIFFLVTLSLGTVQDRASSEVTGEMQEQLPQLPPVSKLSDTRTLTDGYLLHIDEDKDDKVDGDLIAWILDPDYPSLDDVQKDNTGEHGPFSLKDAGRRLRKKIEDRIYLGEDPPPLQVRAHEKTPYGFILEIMTFCNEDSIETVDFHFANVKGKVK